MARHILWEAEAGRSLEDSLVYIVITRTGKAAQANPVTKEFNLYIFLLHIKIFIM